MSAPALGSTTVIQEKKMDTTAEQYDRRRPSGERRGDSQVDRTLSQGGSPSGMADIEVSESTLRGLDVIGTGFGALILLGPLAAVAISMH